MSYRYEIYDNLEELKKADEKLADELVRYAWSEEWKNEDFVVFPNEVEFAKYEGAVNLFNYIDYKRLADDLIKDWDRSLYYASDEGKVVRTSYGF